MKRYNFISTLVAATVIAVSAYADVPELINYQGRLTDTLGNPVPNATYSVTFTIWDVPAGGSPLWSEMHSVVTSSGLFSVHLGTFVTLPDSIFDGTSRYVGITVSPDSEMPRQRLVSTPYSYRVATVDGATGGTISGNTSIQSDLTVSGNVGVGTTTPAAKFNVLNGQIRVGSQVGSAGIEFYPASAGTPTNAGSIMGVGGSPNAIAIVPVGNVGIGTTSPAQKLHVAGNARVDDTLFASNVSSLSPLRLQTGGTTRMYIEDGTGNVGVGTTAPLEQLHVVGNAHISGNLTKEYSPGVPNLAVPIAYASINLSGSVDAGTPNVTSTWELANQRYSITITGESYTATDYVTIVTPVVGGAPEALFATTAAGTGQLRVRIMSSSTGTTGLQRAFQFIVYKP